MTEPAITLDELVREALTGDVDAFAEIVARCRAGLLMTARAILGNLHDAEDAVQEALVSAHAHLGSLREPAAFKPWVYRILVRNARAAKKRPRLRLLGDRDGELPGRRSEADPRIARLVRAVDHLPEKYRWPLSLFYLADLSYREVAEALGIPEGRVKSRLHDARRMIAGRMNHERDE